MPRREMPNPADQDKPFWLARPNVDGETRIIFQTAKPHSASSANAFSAWDVLEAANGEQAPLVLSPSEVLTQALTVGTSNQIAIHSLKMLLRKRTTDSTLMVLDTDYAIYGQCSRGMHQFGHQ